MKSEHSEDDKSNDQTVASFQLAPGREFAEAKPSQMPGNRAAPLNQGPVPAWPSTAFIYRGLDPTGPVPERTHIYRREPPAYPATTPTPGLNAESPTAPLVLPLCT